MSLLTHCILLQYMKEVVEGDPKLKNEGRNLLSVAYKNVVGSRRSAWRVISSLEQKYESAGDDQLKAGLATEYRKTIETELNSICNEVLVCHLYCHSRSHLLFVVLKKLLEDCLIPNSDEVESQVFYLKMKGDYHRYMAEIASKEESDKVKTNAEEAYVKAMERKELPPTHPIRLGLALNFSVFYYEIMNKPDKACEMAKKVNRSLFAITQMCDLDD